ncbi:proline-specific peptidase family protein [Pseudoxanthomonas sangjuensis]|uniref:proline iminopeptidase-family hydrolase n=1 Tax=Pseudoxanthomonas sangjuensis TaxID=1503750 RepID=UPI0013918907|nr:proline iminopeptidase-family hydrolase [Pseudoxanthomonas sangjuensis]KAF1713137.1 proline iminopeptidase [Pseudoxanthomonas sangjuensis]
MKRWLLLVLALLAGSPVHAGDTKAQYFDNTGRDDVLSGGVRMIPIHTPSGDFRVWTKRVGNNPKLKVLLLHGGPGATHEYFEAFDSWFPGAGIEYYYYDQLGSAYSDQPEDMTPFLSIDHYVDEVEQVRQALRLDKENFCLLGHSWGGILAIEYALKYQQNLKCLVISNMMSSIPAYNDYAHEVLMPRMDPAALREILALEAAKRYDDPRYEELLLPYYEAHILHMPAAQWPDPVLRAFARINKKVYVPMQGPSEMGASGILEHWDRTDDLARIAVPTLVIGAGRDTMDPAFMEKMSKLLPHGQYLYCPDGGHMAMYDDQATYMRGLIDFLAAAGKTAD